MWFFRTEPYEMFYKTSMNEDALFKTLDLVPRRGRQGRFNNIELTPLYKNVKPITKQRYLKSLKSNDIMDLLHRIPP